LVDGAGGKTILLAFFKFSFSAKKVQSWVNLAAMEFYRKKEVKEEHKFHIHTYIHSGATK
jgi:hypothetical protein